MSTDVESAVSAKGGGTQTVHRALDVLELLSARERGASIAEIADSLRLTSPTVHRLCRTLLERGYVRQLPDRRYALGTKLVPLGRAAHNLIGIDAESVLADLVVEIGETANLAILSGHQAEYVAQVPSRYSMRMFTEVGRRVDLHSTGVGKALLSQLDHSTVDALLKETGMAKSTAHTIATPTALAAELERIRERGFAVDDQEQELGVRCVAVPISNDSLTWMAISVSGPTARMTDEVVTKAVPLLRSGAHRLAASLATGTSS